MWREKSDNGAIVCVIIYVRYIYCIYIKSFFIQETDEKPVETCTQYIYIIIYTFWLPWYYICCFLIYFETDLAVGAHKNQTVVVLR